MSCIYLFQEYTTREGQGRAGTTEGRWRSEVVLGDLASWRREVRQRFVPYMFLHKVETSCTVSKWEDAKHTVFGQKSMHY